MACLSVVACGCEDSTSTITDAPGVVLPVHVVTPLELQTARRTVVRFGRILPSESVALRFRQPGRVKLLHQAVGEFRRAGEPLAELETPELDGRKRRLETSLKTAEQSLKSGAEGDSRTLRAQVSQIESQLSELDASYQSAVISAPYDGKVIRQYVQAGDSLSSVAPAIHFSGLKSPVVKISLPTDIAGRLRDDQPIWVRIGSEAIVTNVSETVLLSDGSQVSQVELQFTSDLPEQGWDPGQVAEVRFFDQTRESGYWLPVSALQRGRNGANAVFVVRESIVALQEVTVLFQEDGRIFAGRAEGGVDPVIVAGSHRVVVGQRVRSIDVTSRLNLQNAGRVAE